MCAPSSNYVSDTTNQLLSISFIFPFREERNVIEAAAKGASSAITLVANVAAMLITFFAFIAFFNGVLSYLGSMQGYPELSFQASWFSMCPIEIAFKRIDLGLIV